jgi:hypothetical protein
MFFGAWLSLVEHLVRDEGVGGSNPLAPTKYNKIKDLAFGHGRIADVPLLFDTRYQMPTLLNPSPLPYIIVRRWTGGEFTPTRIEIAEIVFASDRISDECRAFGANTHMSLTEGRWMCLLETLDELRARANWTLQ